MKHKILVTKTHVLVLCEMGHLIDSCPIKEFAWSMFEADLDGDRFDRLAEQCQGSGHK